MLSPKHSHTHYISLIISYTRPTLYNLLLAKFCQTSSLTQVTYLFPDHNCSFYRKLKYCVHGEMALTSALHVHVFSENHIKVVLVLHLSDETSDCVVHLITHSL